MREGFFNKEQVASPSSAKGRTLSCFTCGLSRNVITPKIEGYGLFKKEILIIADSPSDAEDTFGKRWRGADYFNKALRDLGIDLYQDCYTVGAINCRPPGGRVPKAHELNCCRDIKVLPAIKLHVPKMILLLGTEAVISLIGHRWQKKVGTITKWRGWNIPDQDYKAWVCPTYHPSFVQKHSDNKALETIWKSDLKRAIEHVTKPMPVYNKPKITVIDDLSELDKRVPKKGETAFDYETTGIKPQSEKQKILTGAITTDPDNVLVFKVPKKKKKLKPLLNYLASAKQKKIASNLKYEDNWSLVKLDTRVKGWQWDTMLAGHILDNRPGVSGLKFQCYVYLGIVDYDSDVSKYITSKKGAHEVNKMEKLASTKEGLDQLLKYNGLDSIYEQRVKNIQFDLIKKYKGRKQAYKLMHDGSLALAEAERQGFRLDIKRAKSEYERLTVLINEIERKVQDTKFYRHWDHVSKGKPNLDSPQQLAYFLYKIKRLKPVKKTPSGQGSTDVESLEALNIPELNQMLRARKLKKIRDTYLLAFLREEVDGFIHPVYNLHTTATYRSSSDSPNWQNIPVRDEEAKEVIRKCLYPRLGHQLLEVDYSGVEVRVAACYHKDPTMIKYIKDHKSDMHRDMAQQIFFLKKFNKKDKAHGILRSGAKNGFVFPQFYGDYYGNNAASLSKWAELPIQGRWKKDQGIILPSGETLVTHLDNNGVGSMKSFISHLRVIENDFWNNRFPAYNQWRTDWWHKYQRTGYFDTLTGFRCSGLMDRNNAINYPVQGSAFHCLLWSFIQSALTMKKMKTKLIGQIHDSIICDVFPPEMKEVLGLIREITCSLLLKHYKWIIVPLDIEAEACEVDQSWYYKKQIKI